MSILYYLDHYKEAQFININQDNSVNKKITVEKNGVKNQPLQPIEGQINKKKPYTFKIKSKIILPRVKSKYQMKKSKIHKNLVNFFF